MLFWSLGCITLAFSGNSQMTVPSGPTADKYPSGIGFDYCYVLYYI